MTPIIPNNTNKNTSNKTDIDSIFSLPDEIPNLMSPTALPVNNMTTSNTMDIFNLFPNNVNQSIPSSVTMPNLNNMVGTCTIY